MAVCHVETYDNQNRTWVTMGNLFVENPMGAVESTPGWFEYDLEYALEAIERDEPDVPFLNRLLPVSKNLPIAVGQVSARIPTWPPFSLDLFPAGSARGYWERLLGFSSDDVRNDFEVFSVGAGNPPGHLRIRPSAETARRLEERGGAAVQTALSALDRSAQWHSTAAPTSSGFSLDEITRHGPEWLDYARRLGAPVSGASGVQGMAPKFLLREAQDGSFHADLECPDAHTRRAVIVKFARPRFPSDRLLIHAEASYLRLAKTLGFGVHGEPTTKDDALVVDRFDRIAGSNGEVLRLGMESLASLAGSSVFGENLRMEHLLMIIATHSVRPEDDVVEFLMRDVFNIAIGNTDNHARNTAFLWAEGGYQLSPLFDVAPMSLSGEGIPRICSFECEFRGEIFPNWLHELEKLAQQFRIKGKTHKKRRMEPLWGTVAFAMLRQRLEHFVAVFREEAKAAGEPRDAFERLARRREDLLLHIEKILGDHHS